MAASNKVIITCAVTGAIHTPTMSPYLAITPDEIAEQSIAAASRLLDPAPPRAGRMTASRRPTRRCSWSSCPGSSRRRTRS